MYLIKKPGLYLPRFFFGCGKARRFLAKRNDFPLLCAICRDDALQEKCVVELSGVACAVNKSFPLPNLQLSPILRILLCTNRQRENWLVVRYLIICKWAYRKYHSYRMPRPWWYCLCSVNDRVQLGSCLWKIICFDNG